MTTPLAALLVDPPVAVPLYLTGFAVDVDFTPAYAGEEDREVIGDAFSELDALLKAGFFAWRHIGARAKARLTLAWRDDGFTVRGEAAGLHHNVLVAVLRMIVSLHHTPLESRAELVAALGDDADALPPPVHWSDQLRAIRFTRLEGEEPTAPRAAFDSFVVDAETIIPAGLMAADADRLFVTGAPFDTRGFTRLEDKFLGVCNTGGFRPLDQIDLAPDEGELFLRDDELVIDAYRDDPYALAEFLNALSRGANASLAVTAD